MEIRRILAPTDFSEPSKQAIAYAFELAQTFEATLVLLHVVEPLDYPMRSYPPPGHDHAGLLGAPGSS